MSETKQDMKQRLFREKSLEALDSPEALNDYLRVTSPRVWLVLAAVIALLLGAILWGIFGRIDTNRQVAVVTMKGRTVCFVPRKWVQEEQKALAMARVTLNGADYTVAVPEDGMLPSGCLYEFFDEADETGKLALDRACKVGNVAEIEEVWAFAVDGAFEDGVKAGTVTVDSLHPISLLLQ